MSVPDHAHGFLGEESRLAEAPSSELAGAAFAFELEAAPMLWQELGVADLAHVAELVECGVIEHATGDELLRALLQFQEDTPLSVATLDPAIGDVYNNRDKLLRDRFGEAVGHIHTGRARREATTLAWHLSVRRLLVEALVAAAELLDALVARADEHRHDLMPDFTYLQHAHPTTLGHYLLGFAYAVQRDIDRLRDALALVDRSPAGSGSVNGSRFPIDRGRLARSLDFTGPIVHTRDAMWAPDIPMTVMAAALAAMVNVDRLVEELQLWSTDEFGFVELADRHCRTSVIMPQKKNPYALAMMRGHARTLLGDQVGITATNLTPTGQPDNRATAYVRVPTALTWTTASLRLLADVLASAEFDLVRMRDQAHTGFSYATDICDHLVQTTGLDNRSAHRVVGRAVREVIAAGRRELTGADLSEAAELLEVDLPALDEDDIARNRDLGHLIELRSGLGGAGALAPMLAELGGVAAEARSAFAGHPHLTFTERFISKLRKRTDLDG